MSNQFDWQFEEDSDERPLRKGRPRWASGSIWFWIIATILTISMMGAWFTAREKGVEETQDLIQAAQAILDIQQQAIADNDGELFFSIQDDDSDWFVAQLLPENQDVNRSGLNITNAEEHGESIWANAIWQEEGGEFQRILFFEWRAGQLRQISTDPNYWGTTLQIEADWGALAYYAVDDPWAATIANYVNDVVVDVCARGCLENRLPFTIEIRDDYTETAEPNRIHMPSPRLLGLNAKGEPSSRFWRQLSKRIEKYLTPATIRFAVPPPRARDGQTLFPYDNLAQQFMALNPEIRIELVHLESLSEENISTLALEFDGAAIPPTEAMLAAGQVHDLTDYINSDPDFDKADFYEQIWQGTLWRERTWFMPEAAEMQVLFYDRVAYSRAEYLEPSSRWTWDEMAQDVSSIVGDQQESSDLAWGFLDVGLDSLLSYAYNWNNQCMEAATIFCQSALKTENIAAALDWYAQMAGQPGQMPDLSDQLADGLSRTQMLAMGSLFDDERQVMLLLNFQGSQRKAAVWVDSPVNYEFNLLLSPVGVVSFPGSDRFDGITPLWVRGSFISQQSERPLAVWRWLNFLSYQSPTPRFIPARPSVAAEMAYWTVLPRPLDDVMRTTFPFARPVTIEEQGMLTWEQVTAVLSGASSPQEAAQNRTKVQWFALDRE